MQRKGPGGEGERTHRGWCRAEGREVGNGCVCLVYRLASENGVTPGTHVLKCAHSIPNLFPQLVSDLGSVIIIHIIHHHQLRLPVQLKGQLRLPVQL